MVILKEYSGQYEWLKWLHWVRFIFLDEANKIKKKAKHVQTFLKHITLLSYIRTSFPSCCHVNTELDGSCTVLGENVTHLF